MVLLVGSVAGVLILRGSDPLRAGACIHLGPQLQQARSLTELDAGWMAEDYDVVPCDEPHHWELMHVFDERDLERFDLQEADWWDVDDICVEELFPRYVRIDIDDSRWDVEVLDLRQIDNTSLVRAGVACVLFDWSNSFDETVSIPARDSRQ